LKVMLARSLLAPHLVERFRREARIQSSVKSEHVVRVVDADVAPELDGAPFLVMELLSGKDFERICTERRPSREEVVDWLRQVGLALDKAHKQRIVHRDLKPENLFLAEREDLPPIVKVLDFGVAKLINEGEDGSTVTGQILGTPRYMAPEQAAGSKKISPAADRFALGLIAFRLLSGRHYFEGDNWVAILQAVPRGPTARPSELGCDHGPAFDAWFARACALDPTQRFGTCSEQVEALAGALAGTSLRRPRLRPTGRALGVAALAGILGTATLVWKAGRDRSDATAPAVVRDSRASAVDLPTAGDAAQAVSILQAPAPVQPVPAAANDHSRRPRRRARAATSNASPTSVRPPSAPTGRARSCRRPRRSGDAAGVCAGDRARGLPGGRGAVRGGTSLAHLGADR
jgi:hypothetical protein